MDRSPATSAGRIWLRHSSLNTMPEGVLFMTLEDETCISNFVARTKVFEANRALSCRRA